jgi:hypothetical protein
MWYVSLTDLPSDILSNTKIVTGCDGVMRIRIVLLRSLPLYIRTATYYCYVWQTQPYHQLLALSVYSQRFVVYQKKERSTVVQSYPIHRRQRFQWLPCEGEPESYAWRCIGDMNAESVCWSINTDGLWLVRLLFFITRLVIDRVLMNDDTIPNSSGWVDPIHPFLSLWKTEPHIWTRIVHPPHTSLRFVANKT